MRNNAKFVVKWFAYYTQCTSLHAGVIGINKSNMHTAYTA